MSTAQPNRWKSYAWRTGGLALSAAFLYLAFRDVDLTQLFDTIKNTELWAVALGVALNFAIIWLKGWRWRELITAPRQRRVPVYVAFLATLIGYGASCFLPARAGEVVRILVLHRREGLSRAGLLGALALDHILEGLGMVLLLLALPFLMATPGWLRSSTVGLAVFVCVALAVPVAIVWTEGSTTFARIPFPEKWREKLAGPLTRLRTGLSAVKRPGIVANALGLTAAIWALQAVMVLVCLRGLGIDLTLAQAVFVLMAVNIAVLLPAGPGNLGTFEYATVLALAFLGVDNTRALSGALLYHGLQVLPTMLGGLFALPKARVRLRDVEREGSP